MANIDAPAGFKIADITQDPQVQELTLNAIATAIFIGDQVKLLTAGTVELMAAASDDYVGIVVGLKDSDGKDVSTLAASTAGSVLVATNPLLKLRVQDDASGTPTVAFIGDCADGTYTTGTVRSAEELNGSVVGDGNQAQFRIIDKVDTEGNDWDDNVELIVVAAQHAFITTPNAI